MDVLQYIQNTIIFHVYIYIYCIDIFILISYVKNVKYTLDPRPETLDPRP